MILIIIKDCTDTDENPDTEVDFSIKLFLQDENEPIVCFQLLCL